MRQAYGVVFGLLLLLALGVGFYFWSSLNRARDAAADLERDAARAAVEVAARTAPEPRPATLPRGVAFLLQQQSPDGAWRSDVYGTFKDGTALTPLVVCALQEAGTSVPGTSDAVRKGSEYLAKLIKPDGTVDVEGGLDYPVYTAAQAVVALSHPDNKDHLKARDAWLKYLLDRQLTEKLGWKPGDKEFGGWGYCRAVPAKPEPGKFAPPLIESNLSATVFALEALRAAGVADTAVYEKALVFVRRCQNDDGGFHFIYDDPVRNKAGAVEQSPGKPAAFHSYGSTTADGARALLACGLPADDPAVRSARDWLAKNFRADAHPGVYVPQHERNRDAVYYYYAASVSKAFRQLGVKEVGGKDWALELVLELARRQKDDGSWANPVELVRENDPIVASANAMIALANCKAAMIGQ
jgi:squalene-hopene/tetraprenyl-beta-curcumene cyclase